MVWSIGVVTVKGGTPAGEPSKLAVALKLSSPEDRCHLNGLAMRAEEPAYVTAVSKSDVVTPMAPAVIICRSRRSCWRRCWACGGPR